MTSLTRHTSRLQGERGQSLLEFAMILPLLLVLALGIVEVGFAMVDQHIITKLSREGSNLISRDATMAQAQAALTAMSSNPVNFANGSKVIFSVLKKGETQGTSNYGQMILYQRHQFGNYSGSSHVTTQGSGSYPPPTYTAPNSDNNTGLRVTSLPHSMIVSNGGMIYVTEIFTSHELITPFHRFGVNIPTTLYSIAYF
jgi:TadE-like protein